MDRDDFFKIFDQTVRLLNRVLDLYDKEKKITIIEKELEEKQEDTLLPLTKNLMKKEEKKEANLLKVYARGKRRKQKLSINPDSKIAKFQKFVIEFLRKRDEPVLKDKLIEAYKTQVKDHYTNRGTIITALYDLVANNVILRLSFNRYISNPDFKNDEVGEENKKQNELLKNFILRMLETKSYKNATFQGMYDSYVKQRGAYSYGHFVYSFKALQEKRIKAGIDKKD